MLLNNFKPLISFSTTGSFKDVTGNTIDKGAILAGQNVSYTNNHQSYGSNLQYNYSATTASNTYTNEQTAYTWWGVVRSQDNFDQNTPNKFANGFTLFVGSGTTAVTAADYKLENPLTLDVLSASCLPQATEKVYVQRTFKNSTGSSVTINEIGCYVFNSTPYTLPVVMIGRKVLESPVTIADGDLYTFTYVIDMSNITLQTEDVNE